MSRNKFSIVVTILLNALLLAQLFANVFFFKSDFYIGDMSEKDKHNLYLEEDYLTLWKDIDKDLVVDCSGPFSDEIQYNIIKDSFVVYRYYSDWQDQYLSYMLIDLGDGFVARTMMFEPEEDIKVWDKNEKEYQINYKDKQYEVNQQLEEVCPMSTQEIICTVNESKTQYFLLLEKVHRLNADQTINRVVEVNMTFGVVEIILCLWMVIQRPIMKAIEKREDVDLFWEKKLNAVKMDKK